MSWMKRVDPTAETPKTAAFAVGDEVRVWVKIMEQGKERLSPFEGTVIRLRGSGRAQTFTVRRVTFGEGVERVFPSDARAVARIEVLRRGQVRRARLYYLRRAVGKTRIAAKEEPSSAASPATATTATRPATRAE